MRPTSRLLKDSFHYSSIIRQREKYLTPVLKTFVAARKPIMLTRGEKQYVWNQDNQKLLDLVGQNLTISVGHCHPTVVDRAVNQMKTLSHCSTMYYHEQPTLLAKEIIQTLPPHPSGEDWVVHFVNDGSEAIDLTVQMIRNYTGRSELISLYKAYHGLQGYAAGLTAIGKATQPGHASMFNSITHLPANNVKALQDHLTYSTGQQVGGIIVEPVQGYGGVYPLDPGYLQEVYQITREHGGVAVADEVQTGYGRCGEAFWGFQLANNQAIPDMITMAKGMGNGVGLIGAVATKRSIAEAFAHKMFFNTYGSNPVACAAARGVLEVIREERLDENCQQQGRLLRQKLEKLCQDLPDVYREVRGHGLFLALEVYGRDNQESIENSYSLHEQLLKQGLLIGRGSAAGNVFRIQPPMCLNGDDVDLVVDTLETVGREWRNQKK